MSPSTSTLAAPSGLAQSIRDQVQQVVAIDDQTIEVLLTALFAGGHSLIEGIPGIGKTLLARTLARCVDCDFRRVQFTNDLMPSDIIGTAIWRQSTESFDFTPGPLFANIVLADEINRTSPRTLSCLLEAMEAGRVSVDGKTMDLAAPFMVWATRNPIEFHGTYPIPEAALDRFLVRVELSYPDEDAELALYQGDRPEDRLEDLQAVLSRQELIARIAEVREVRVAEPVASYAYKVVAATREHQAVTLGASPRAALAWLQAAKARAYLDGRSNLLPDDLMALAPAVLAHRIFLAGSGSAADILKQIMADTPVEL